MMSNRVLLETVMTFPLDTAQGRPSFLEKLCLASGWTRGHAERVIVEYRRFLYLCAAFPEAMMPSGDVDQVWQLHLCYTQSYWEEYCMKILGRPLHHQPVLQGRQERTRAYVWYERARRRYAQEFGEAPPADIWRAADELFGPERVACERVNLNRYWIVPKPRIGLSLTLVLPAVVLPLAVGSFDWAAGVVTAALAALGIWAAAVWTDYGQRRGMARN